MMSVGTWTLLAAAGSQPDKVAVGARRTPPLGSSGEDPQLLPRGSRIRPEVQIASTIAGAPVSGFTVRSRSPGQLISCLRSLPARSFSSCVFQLENESVRLATRSANG